ncbi:MAG: UDP-glucose 4-epimerase [Rhodospirillaceae bacterium]|nr:UDP-glucose 4-epimerase [Rhodospirillaceae bacterium]|tara:strand:+ start:1699 stop:2700 length:1002 start_codon:yes stop_codon:yes gene_type:complete
MKHILITGGAGYVGSRLVPQLLAMGNKVTVFDIMYYGNSFLPLHDPNLTVITGDLRDITTFSVYFEGVDVVIHLGCISNDASFELNEALSRTINYESFEALVIVSKKGGVKRFIYASSSSVYGVSSANNVTEDHPLVPLTLYNKYKGLCEPILFKHQSRNFTCVTIRPATLCGYAPRQRLDLTVNILTNWAVNRGKIKVFGGDQLRPNLHIQDMCDLYIKLIYEDSAKIAGQTFNVGYQNMSIMQIALIVKNIVEEKTNVKDRIKIETSETNDMRSYHINSDKIKCVLGFEPRFTIEDAIAELCHAFGRGEFPHSFDKDKYFNVRQMKALNVF